MSDFISKLLVKDPRKRLGGGEEDAEELKRHPFFNVSSFSLLIITCNNNVYEGLRFVLELVCGNMLQY